MSKYIDCNGKEVEFNPFGTESHTHEIGGGVSGPSSTYGHLFDNEVGSIAVDFDTLILDVNEDNKHVVIPLLFKLAVQAEQVSKVREICERINFDIACLEREVSPKTLGNA
ncbi:hypothetical protein J4N45_11090 [Vibrio sp. SCSIO 43140]|uniref:hypothetical protein n=1 Tax=Vibrio sp. SCSIO 43140 TaxID=2819100 RepID=UPI0020752301|nr:hypothetical protein [Vibrio sp. SCSIO 43140]USD59076.1 hypothetical protein J4N45_11090 [Vibrio sp. SCSIO 43140]